MKKIFAVLFCMVLLVETSVFANTYDFSQCGSVKAITEYSTNTTIDMMDTVTFGSYPQSDETGITKEPIEWIVLEKQENQVLLLSKYILAGKVFDHNLNDEGAYAKSRIRNWLNDSFYQMAFSTNEQNKISDTLVDGTCNDKVFLLSGPECDQYFGFANTYDSLGTNQLIATRGTKYSSSGTDDNILDVADNGNSEFWLRTPGEFGICAVTSFGWFDWTMSKLPDIRGIGVRPAIWVKY